jgi:hypothetical protein
MAHITKVRFLLIHVGFTLYYGKQVPVLLQEARFYERLQLDNVKLHNW